MPDYPEVSFPLDGFLPEPTGASIREPARDVTVIADCDVAVLGGGPAGACAAAAAATCGASVLLIERFGFLGGMSTAGIVNMWHPFYGMDGRTLIMGGFPRQLVQRLQGMGAVYNTAEDGETGNWVVCSEHARFAFDDMVLASGAKILVNAHLAGAIRDGRRVTAALIETKSGRGAVLAKSFIDCTGDADLVRRTGVATELGDSTGACQAPTLCYRIDNLGPGGLGALAAELAKHTMNYNGEPFPAFFWGDRWPGTETEHFAAGTRVLDVNCADALSLTRAEIEARYQLRWVLERARQMPGWGNLRLVAIAAALGLRESHRIIAEYRVTGDDLLWAKPFEDAIAQGTYPIDIHTPGAPGIVFNRLDGTFHRINPDHSTETGRWDGEPLDAPKRDTLCYQVPLRSLIARDLDNVFAAGRCAGMTHEAAGALRVMVNCMQTGQAAGVAAALSEDGNARSATVAQVQDRLRELGMPLR